jgi:DNA-binding Lrp family transcriptional regulator
MSAPIELDQIDLRVLRVLQASGRATYDEIAQVVNLSPSATLRRVKRLEESKVISGYVALLDPEGVGKSTPRCTSAARWMHFARPCKPGPKWSNAVR